MSDGRVPYRLRLPIPPSLNGYYMNAARKTKDGRRYTGRMVSPEGLAYRGEVEAAARRGHRAPPQLAGHLAIFVLVCKPNQTKAGAQATLRKGDLDNLWKCLLDALTNAKVIGDDVQFDDVRMVRGNLEQEGSVYLCISRFDPDAALAAADSLGLPFHSDVALHPSGLPF